MQLADLWRGGLSLRRLSVLVEGLPPNSRIFALQSDLPYGWTLTDILLTDLFHATAGSPHPARPDPGATDKKAAVASIAERLVAMRDASQSKTPPS